MHAMPPPFVPPAPAPAAGLGDAAGSNPFGGLGAEAAPAGIGVVEQVRDKVVLL